MSDPEVPLCPLSGWEAPFFARRGLVPCLRPQAEHVEIGRSEGLVSYGLPGDPIPHFVVPVPYRAPEPEPVGPRLASYPLPEADISAFAASIGPETPVSSGIGHTHGSVA